MNDKYKKLLLLFKYYTFSLPAWTIVIYFTYKLMLFNNEFLRLAFACGQDTDLHISEQVFEAEFNKLYATKEDEAKAAVALAAAEQEVKS